MVSCGVGDPCHLVFHVTPGDNYTGEWYVLKTNLFVIHNKTFIIHIALIYLIEVKNCLLFLKSKIIIVNSLSAKNCQTAYATELLLFF